MVVDGVVVSTSGSEVPITADTLCIHGDGRQALTFAREIRLLLEAEGIVMTAFHEK
jgi:UPF0271 protein